MIVRNHKELLEAFQTVKFSKFFISTDAEGIIKESLD